VAPKIATETNKHRIVRREQEFQHVSCNRFALDPDHSAKQSYRSALDLVGLMQVLEDNEKRRAA
jgi:hypothetical protein